ncbi:MAG: hypothetical protein KJ787_14055 [Gammaproteobacteria bacterium]|nr:hypothetical protein [Gammaproteobacteria bacterium]MBU1647451.1 hypothetical protein [Gammaproteobacteria bacterium]MBU1973243.1 hypothetical protein [Gammaproteobacteria bacterium]
MSYQKSINATAPISKATYSISIFGDAADNDYPPRCNVNVWNSCGCTSINLRPEDARQLAAHLALAAIAAERGDAEIIDFPPEKVAA